MLALGETSTVLSRLEAVKANIWEPDAFVTFVNVTPP